ncbi:MAG: GNAT family N-acetyltransferase [Bacteroidales bacterium]|nr:GNAT family N-acetyltransferase [Bacteroidales bacterium]
MLRIVSDPHKIDRAAWSKFVLDHPHGNIFQTPEMYHVYENTQNYSPRVVAVLNNDTITGLVVGVIQKEYSGLFGKLSARSIVMGGPLVAENDSETLSLLLKEYNKMNSGVVIYSQIRNFFPQDSRKPTFETHGFSFVDHLNIILELRQGADRLWSDFSRSRKKGIKKALSSNLIFEASNSPECLDDFYHLLSINYKRIRLPHPDKIHFNHLIGTLKPGSFKFFEIRHNGRVVVSLLALVFRDTIYGYYIGSTDDPLTLKQKPIDLLFWEVFKWAIDHQINYFDWMGAGKPDKDYGVRDFKLQFGGTAINLGRYERIHHPLLYKVSSFGFRIWQKLR